MKKIAFCVLALNTGGIENYLLRFIKYSNKQYEATIICKSDVTGELEDEFKKLGVEIISVKTGYLNLFALWKLSKIFKKNRYDAICDFTGDFAAFILVAGRLADISKRITFYRNSQYTFKMNFLKRIFLTVQKMFLNANATLFLSNSELAMDVFHPGWKNKLRTKYKVIKNGVPFIRGLTNNNLQLKNELCIPSDYKIIGHVSSFRKQKNHTTIIKVAKNLIDEYPKIKFLLIGKGVKEGLSQQLKEEELEDYFIIPGLRNDIPQLLNIMDAFIFPSTIEGQPNALIEAMLYEVPIFASNIPTIEDSTPADVKQNLFPPHDYKAYTNAIKTYLKTGKTYDVKKVSYWARKEFNPEVRFKEFLEELI